MKRLIILLVLMIVLLACSSTKDADKEEKKDAEVKETEITEDEEEKEESKEGGKTTKNKKESEEKSAVKNEKVEIAAENIIWAQNDRDYSVLRNYLGQNITLNEKTNTLKITNVEYPHDVELLKGIKKGDLEHRFTNDEGQDHIVGFAVIDYETEMSYTIDLTMRVGKDSWKMLNMQINK